MCYIGLVGPFGSGCSYVANKIQKMRETYKYVSLSDELRKEWRSECPDDDLGVADREALQEFGDKKRKENGASYWAERVYLSLEENGEEDYIIDSIRNPQEVEFFRKKLPNFFLIGVFAEPDIRWDRVKAKYCNDRRMFDEDDKRDSDEKVDYGQRVTASFKMADIIILNNEDIKPGNEFDEILKAKIDNYLDLIHENQEFNPTDIESNMTMAYAMSLRSSCIKRKVGAVIADAEGNVFSSGFNEVPIASRPCKAQYGKCYRDTLKDEYKEGLDKRISDSSAKEVAYGLFRDNFKILDYCRALHAEENAILNVAKVGASSALLGATLFTTTYPCNLCANKIAQVGIKSIVYFEPYPMKEAKIVLDEKKVVQQPFEGVTYNGYFRFMEVDA